LTPIIVIKDNVPEKDAQITEYRLDLEMLPKDKGFDKKRQDFIKKLGSSVNAVSLCNDFFKELSSLIKEAEVKFGNKQHYLRSKIKSKFRANSDLTLLHYERSY